MVKVFSKTPSKTIWPILRFMLMKFIVFVFKEAQPAGAAAMH